MFRVAVGGGKAPPPPKPAKPAATKSVAPVAASKVVIPNPVREAAPVPKNYAGRPVAVQKAPQLPKAAAPVSDAASSGGYGLARANAYKKTPAYTKAVVDTFRVQPKQQQVAILKGALSNPTHEGKAVLDFLGGKDPVAESSKSILAGVSKAPFSRQAQAVTRLQSGSIPLYRGIASKYGMGVFSGVKGNPVSALTYATATAQDQKVLDRVYGKGQSRTNLRSQQIGGGATHPLSGRDKVAPLPKSAVSQSTGQVVEGAISNFLGHPISANISQGEHALGVTGKFLTQPAVNAAKDAWDLPAETLSSVGQIGGDIAQGKFKAAGQSLISPYEQLVKHPLKMLAQHPLDTALLVKGGVDAAVRPLEAGARAVSGGKIASLDRPAVALTGKLTDERPSYSPYASTRLAQKAREAVKFTKDEEGNLRARRESLQSKLVKTNVSRIVGENERVRRANRDALVGERVKDVQPKLPVRAAKQVERTLAYGSKRITIRGADQLMSLVADGTIRRPDTFHADLEKYIGKISAGRHDLLDNPALLKEHDETVKALKGALTDKKLDANAIRGLFKASDRYAESYPKTQREAANFGHFGPLSDMPKLTRAVLQHYAMSHLDARIDPELGLVTDRVRSTGDGIGTARQLPNSEIVAHMKSPEGLGGRRITFTSDKAKPGSAFYLSSERRPLPETAKRTGFAYEHGLQDMSHDALLRQHVRMQGVVDAHKAVNRLLDQVAVQKPEGGYWKTYSQAAKDAPAGYRPINVAQAFHPQDSLDQALEGTDPEHLDDEAAARGLDLSGRLARPSDVDAKGRWALVHQDVTQRLAEHQSLITPNLALRGIGSVNNQFRRVALSLSPKHIPGVIAEQIIRNASEAVGFFSWLRGHQILRRAEKIDPVEGRNVRTRLTGGQLAGSTQAMTRHFVGETYKGTSVYPVLKGIEKLSQAPGPRQLSSAWQAWTHFMIGGTKHVLENQHAIADVGKTALRDFGSKHGPVAKALRLHGAMLDDAAKGLFDPKKMRQFRVEQDRIRGRWNDLTPHGQMAVMASPFGLWEVNSLRWLGRFPLDHPPAAGALAAANLGTQNQRDKYGLDEFAKNALPAYMQGGIPIGSGRVLAQNYYSPFGVANNPVETAGSLLLPWLTEPLMNAFGDNYLGEPLTSNANPYGDTKLSGSTQTQQRITAIANSLLSMFVPLYQKAQAVEAGGAKEYDTDSLFSELAGHPQTSGPRNAGAGLAKSLLPVRIYSSPKSTGGTVTLKSSIGSVSGGDLKRSLGVNSTGGDLATSLK